MAGTCTNMCSHSRIVAARPDDKTGDASEGRRSPPAPSISPPPLRDHLDRAQDQFEVLLEGRAQYALLGSMDVKPGDLVVSSASATMLPIPAGGYLSLRDGAFGARGTRLVGAGGF